jgi:hypothetical protein
LLNLPERLFVGTLKIFDAKTDYHEQKQASQLKFHLALLTDATATRQQLPITLNNFRLFACDQGCVPLLAVLSTPCSAATSGRSAGVVGEEKEKNEWALN